MTRHLLRVVSGVIVLAGVSRPLASEATGVAEVLLKGLKARAIGPAVMGGRVTAIALDPTNASTYYVGFGTGGLWKTANAGVTFAPLFDEQPVLSIGAVAVARSRPEVVWVGTGEGTDRNSAGWGAGVYLSTNAGANWSCVGLKGSRAIRSLVVHPTNPDLAYVAAMGSLWAPGGERGLYKTTNAGASWERVLSAPVPHDRVTGCSDVVMDAANPEVLYAALYARQRRPWAFLYGTHATEGADVGGVFKSTNGGVSWVALTNGLPRATGRIGLAASASKPGVVMALVQSDEGGTSDIDDNHSRRGGIFRSEDGGAQWTRVNALCPRPFYFGRLVIDPVNDQRVYVLGWMVFVSDDGGGHFREDGFAKVHPDVHALAIDPASAPPPGAEPSPGKPARLPVCQRLVLGTDGGVYQSFDATATWDFLNKIPAGQFYRIEVEGGSPYRIAGGLQDNCNWVGPSRTSTREGIGNADWTMIGGGDGFYTVFDPEDRDVIFAESQGGEIHRFNGRTGEMRDFRPDPTEGQAAYRFHWNAPLIGSRHRPGVMYLGGNRIFRLTHRGEHFEIISPDLSHAAPEKTTATGSAAENYAVVYALAESPLRAGRLFAGTDDGRLWCTDDDGGKWTELTEWIPSEVRGKWVARIEPSHHDAGAGYVAFTGYRDGDDSPHLYRFEELGQRWTVVRGDLPASAPVSVVREDPVNPDLLFAGTESGLWVSLDRGGRWVRFGGLPPVRVDDLKIQAREGDLVVATHGRSLYILDDLRPLRELRAEVQAKPVHLFSIRPAHGRLELPGWAEWRGGGEFQGANPPVGALVHCWIREFTGDPLQLVIKDAGGRPVAKWEQPAVPGISRIVWDLKLGKEFRGAYGGDQADRFVPAGEYTVELSLKDHKATQTVTVTVEAGLPVHGTFRQ